MLSIDERLDITHGYLILLVNLEDDGRGDWPACPDLADGSRSDLKGKG